MNEPFYSKIYHKITKKERKKRKLIGLFGPQKGNHTKNGSGDEGTRFPLQNINK